MSSRKVLVYFFLDSVMVANVERNSRLNTYRAKTLFIIELFHGSIFPHGDN